MKIRVSILNPLEKRKTLKAGEGATLLVVWFF
jgi:hypothetical protein